MTTVTPHPSATRPAPRARTAARAWRRVLVAGAVPVLLASVLAVGRPSWIVRLDAATYDALLRSIPARPTSGRVAIVDVDERSLALMGQWPWRRDVIGRLVARAREAGASVVALDVIFAEPDRADAEAEASLTARPTPDALLAGTLKEGGVVLGYAATFDAPAVTRRPCTLHPAAVTRIEGGSVTESPLFQATDAVCSLTMLGDAAGASGFLNAVPDADGVLRRAPLLIEMDGRAYPGLALAAVSKAQGVRSMTLTVSNVNASTLALDGHSVGLDGKGNALLRYRGQKGSLPYVSAADVLGGAPAARALRDKIVFVGTTALGTREVVSTPLDTRFAGVEVHATIADNLLQHDFISRPPSAASLEGLLTLAAGALAAALACGVGVVAAFTGASASLIALWLFSFSRLSDSGLYLSPLMPTMGVASALSLMTLTKLAIERRRADRAGRNQANTERLMLQSLLSLTETRDAETGRHSRRTQRYARLLASQLSTHPAYRHDLTPERVELLASLAPLHDIGKVGVPDHILNKPGTLTAEEFVEMKKHPSLGYDALLKTEREAAVQDDATMAMAKDIVYTHHERWDGTGYPRGLRGDAIPIPGRIMAVVDVYDATTTRTLYRPSMPHDASVKLIVAGTGTHFDPAVVEAFVAVAPAFQAVSQEAELLKAS